VLDIVQAGELRDDMIRLLAQGSLLIDAGAVERMSTPTLQILLAAGRAAESSACGFQIVSASEAFRAAVADLGLEAEFKNWVS
jgi:anti-anti-sigma regulatory factor